MAIITSTTGFSYEALHLGNLVSYIVTDYSASDLLSYSLPNADFLAVQWEADGQTYVTAFAGSDFVVQNGILVSGTIEGALEATVEVSSLSVNLNWSILDMQVDVADLVAVALTPSPADDLALMAQALSGDDSFLLSDAVDNFSAGAGNDTVSAAGGDDTVYGGEGKDVIRGQAGNDVLFGEAGADKLFGNVGNDKLYGGAQNDVLNGGIGRDFLVGGAGKDFIKGGVGADRVVGGWGADTMVAQGADTFVYKAIGESGIGANRRDVIRDFDTDIAKIALAQIDADTSTEADDAFAFSINAAANSVWFKQVGEDVILRADVDGDAAADMAILFEGATLDGFDASVLIL
ncbi:calcium-binding protein [Donghicola tyrosinivorans]|uniref:Hemolysin type calcium-binding protein n=1 Tax=Donghicola tyrosinivorans TaxID=1652492 RepID=A0A2T0WMG8_9RHOB|nr:hypothetical protein [Donghicola tyrosinivorans]PRY87852.1 hemolysin type calcium-binding protein [Donghicola tyrosinivorans]